MTKKIILDLENNEEAEVNLFISFLHSKQYPQHRGMIFSCFPELKEKLDLQQKEDEESTVRDFLKVIREKNKDNIEKSVVFIKSEIEKHGEKTLEILADLMNYKWKPKSDDYFLVPTIFPSCPFNGNTFFYSIYRSLDGITEYPKVLAVSAHEVSHIILFDILKDEHIELNQELLYFVKELIAPVLVYQDDFNGIFKKEIVGNYNVLEVYFEQDNKVIKAFDYFLEMFMKNRSAGKDFTIFLGEIITVCRGVESEIKEKRNFDNTYGPQIMKDPELLAKFREPIKLK